MPRGRTRTFDADAALDRAVDLFARRGYEGTSIAELTAVMGINPPSLYAAYGNKRKLFDLVVERYAEHRRAYLEAVMGQPTARLAVQRFLEGAAEHDTAPGEPRGCLTVQGGLATNVDDQEVAAFLAERRAANQDVLQRRLEQGVADGDLPAETDCVSLARYLSLHGLAGHLRAGVGRGFPRAASRSRCDRPGGDATGCRRPCRRSA
jgi:AcrR family transcriptional regulator